MNTPTKRVALYLRVSTNNGQTTDNQRRELEQVAARSGWQIVKVYQDNGISGSKGREQRPGLDAMMKAVTRREVDMIAAWSVDRLGRSLIDLLGLLKELHAKNVDLYLHQQGLDTSTPAGLAQFQMMGVFAEFERSMIRERINAGLARTVAQGTKLGRKPLAAAKVEAIRAERARGTSIRAIAAKLDVGIGTVARLVGGKAACA